MTTGILGNKIFGNCGSHPGQKAPIDKYSPSKLTQIANSDLKAKLAETHSKFEKHREHELLHDFRSKKQKQKNLQKNKDLFEWLFVPSKFKILRKMVRSKLVELIRDSDRFRKIEIATKNFDTSLVNDPHSSIYEHRINI
jgi:hypothetical protein